MVLGEKWRETLWGVVAMAVQMLLSLAVVGLWELVHPYRYSHLTNLCLIFTLSCRINTHDNIEQEFIAILRGHIANVKYLFAINSVCNCVSGKYNRTTRIGMKLKV